MIKIQKNQILGFVLSAVFFSIILIYKKFSGEVITMVITFYIIFFIVNFLPNGKSAVKYDELTISQDMKSFRNSWLITLMTISLIGCLDYFEFYAFEMNVALFVILASMMLSFWISHFFYLRKPDAK